MKKTSNRLVILALLIILLSLIAYDFLLTREFSSGRYKIPYKDYVTLNFKNFDIVEVNASTVANVKFVQGPFSVRVDKNALSYVRVLQQAGSLHVNVISTGNSLFNHNPYVIVITCPKLTQVFANAEYISDQRRVTDTIVREWDIRQVLIDGFIQDSMSIIQDYGSTVVLANNNIRSIHAVIGKSERSGSTIILQDSNKFKEASLEIRHRSKLLLENATIQNLSYQLADEAKLVVNGNAQNLLNHSKQYRK